MNIAHIYAFAKKGNPLKYKIDYLTVEKEDAESYTVADHPDGIEPRAGYLSKEINVDRADDGYASLNMVCWLECEERSISGGIYVKDDQIEQGKTLLQKAFLHRIDQKIERYEELKKLIQ